MDTDSPEQGRDVDGRKGFLIGRPLGIWAGAKLLHKLRYLTIPLIVSALFVALAGDAMTQSAPTLGSAESFGVLGGSTVTNTGPTTVNGDLGVSPGSAVTGFPPGSVVPPSQIYENDAVAQQAQDDVTISYNNLAGQTCDTDLTGQDLGGRTLMSGVYCFSSSAQLTGDLTLNAQGNADAVFIFQIGSTLTTASDSSVVFINISGEPSCNVFWQVGSSATLGTNTEFAGNILALTSITLNTGASVTGRVLARNGAVTMDSNTIKSCAAAPNPTSTSTPISNSTSTSTPISNSTSTSTPIPNSTSTSTPLPNSTSTSTPIPNSTSTSTPPPTAVELLYFMVGSDGQTVVLNWATEEEVDNYGFNLYRAPVSDFSQAELIHFEPTDIQGGTGSGTTYRHLDTPPVQGTWWYWLADIDTHDVQTIHNPPVAITVPLHVQIYLPQIGIQ